MNEPMRTREEVQRAHDILAGLILKPDIAARLDEDARRLIVMNLDVLCWVLCHDHNLSFPGMLKVIEDSMTAMGFGLARHPEMQYPKGDNGQ